MFIAYFKRRLFMTDDYARYVLELFQIFQKRFFRFLIKRGGSLVKQKHGRFTKHGSCYRKTLHLPL